LQFLLVVGSIYNMALRGSVSDDFRLSTEFETKKFGDIDGRTSEIVGYVEDIGDDSFDAVAFSFDLRLALLFKRGLPLTALGAFCIDRRRHRRPCGY
jgi:hypothetical protein